MALSGKQVLFIDDGSSPLRPQLAPLLESFGMGVITTGNLKEGLLILKREPIHLVIIHEPAEGTRAISFLLLAKGDPRSLLHHLDVLVLTKTIDRGKIFRLRQLGVRQILLTPLVRDDLRSRLEIMLPELSYPETVGTTLPKAVAHLESPGSVISISELGATLNTTIPLHHGQTIKLHGHLFAELKLNHILAVVSEDFKAINKYYFRGPVQFKGIVESQAKAIRQKQLSWNRQEALHETE